LNDGTAPAATTDASPASGAGDARLGHAKAVYETDSLVAQYLSLHYPATDVVYPQLSDPSVLQVGALGCLVVHVCCAALGSRSVAARRWT
jgi:hypothetical protein